LVGEVQGPGRQHLDPLDAQEVDLRPQSSLVKIGQHQARTVPTQFSGRRGSDSTGGTGHETRLGTYVQLSHSVTIGAWAPTVHRNTLGPRGHLTHESTCQTDRMFLMAIVERRAQRTREILDATRRLFDERRMRDAQIEDIAR